MLNICRTKKVSKEFAVYYDLFNKYKSDYQVKTILDGSSTDIIKERARKAAFDERLALLGLILDAVTEEMRNVCLTEHSVNELLSCLQMVKLDLSSSEPDAIKSIEKQIGMVHKRIETGRLSSTLSYDVEYALNSAIVSLETMKTEIFEKKPTDGKVAFKQLKAAFDKRVKSLEKTIDKAGQELSNVFHFAKMFSAMDRRC